MNAAFSSGDFFFDIPLGPWKMRSREKSTILKSSQVIVDISGLQVTELIRERFLHSGSGDWLW